MAIDGTYDIVLQTPQGNQELTLTLAADGATATGVARDKSSGEQMAIQDGTVDGDTIAFKLGLTRPMKVTVSFTAAVKDTLIAGTATVLAFTLKFEGKRV